MRVLLEPLLVRHGVTVVFSGHEHIYERTTPQKGITYFIEGSSGQLRKGGVTPSATDSSLVRPTIARSCWSRSLAMSCSSRPSRVRAGASIRVRFHVRLTHRRGAHHDIACPSHTRRFMCRTGVSTRSPGSASSTSDSCWLPLGAALALAWANTGPESYFRTAHALAFPVNEIGMAIFLGLITQEALEAVMPGGSPRRVAPLGHAPRRRRGRSPRLDLLLLGVHHVEVRRGPGYRLADCVRDRRGSRLLRAEGDLPRVLRHRTSCSCSASPRTPSAC